VTYEGTEYRMYFEEAGNPNGIPMVCLHTAGTDGREWRHQLCDEKINKDFRVIAIDLPRHGKSIPPYEWYQENEEYKLTAKYYSGIIMAFTKALGLEKPVIMGSSMGGNICLHLARDYEDEVSALIAVEACEWSPGWHLDWLRHAHIHGGEVCATSVFGSGSRCSFQKQRRSSQLGLSSSCSSQIPRFLSCLSACVNSPRSSFCFRRR
jgi:pimeloyl-ACP methyl ester carboxylesterase